MPTIGYPIMSNGDLLAGNLKYTKTITELKGEIF